MESVRSLSHPPEHALTDVLAERAVPAGHGPGHVEFATTDPQEAYDFLNAVHGVDLELQGLNPGDALSVTGDDIGQVRFTRFRSPGRLRWQLPPVDEVIINRPLAGTQRRETGRLSDRLASGDVAVIAPPDQSARGINEALSSQTVAIDVRLLEELATNDPEAPASVTARFGDCRPLAEADAERWRRVVRIAEDLVTRGEDSALVRRETARFIAAAALTLFGGPAAEPVAGDRTDATPATLRRATAFIDAHAGEDVSVAQVAAAAGVSVRAIQLAFRQHLQLTPLSYLRRVRLQRAHAELVAGVKDGAESVSAIAARWGFYSPGRFSAAYREQFGELPSDTFRG